MRTLIESLAPDHVVAVPGNHDLTWDDAFQEDRELFFKQLVESALSDLEIRAAFDGTPRVVAIDNGSAFPLALLLLDSCRLEGREMAGLGRVGDDQLTGLEAALNDAGISSATHCLIAVLHHHLLPVTTTEVPADHDPRQGPFPRISLTVDAIEVLRRLSLLGVTAVVHGHQHSRALLEFRNIAWRAQPPSIHVAACGTCGGRDARQFFLIEIADASWTATSWAQHPDNPRLFAPEAGFPPVSIAIKRPGE